jgi:acetyltransferase-like isoleucine patch superfamily enzyme
MKILNYFLLKIKGESYFLDSSTPLNYIVWVIVSRFIMYTRGKLSFVNNRGMLFVGKNVTIKARSRFAIGKGCTIDNGCYIDAISKDGILFGNNVSIGKRTVIECSGSLKYLGKGLIVGNNVGLGRDCYYGCAGGIEIDSDTIIGNFVSFHSENHNISNLNVPIRLQGVNHKGIKVGRNCWIGAKATVLDGATINDGCIIAAGAVVSAGVYEANGIYGGIPAKLIRKR